MKKINALICFAFLCICGGCASSPTYLVEINGFASPDASNKKRFVILPGLEGINAHDLEFKEYSATLSKVLVARGFISTDQYANAEIAVFLAYSIGEPNEHLYTYSMPVFGQTGVASSSTYGTVQSTGFGGATYSGATYNTPSYGITGYTSNVGSFTTYTRVVSITGTDLSEYRNSQKIVDLWKTKIISVGISPDMRRAFPALLAAAEPYIAMNTGQILNIEIHEDDSRILMLRSQPPKTESK